jgi:hypothetical protein
MADFANTEDANVAATQAYTKVEIERALKVQELMHLSGYPSYQELTYMIQDGNLTHLPKLTTKDVQRAQNLHGSAPEFVQGHINQKKTRKAIVDNDLVLEDKRIVLHTDAMHVDSQRFMATVCKPLQLTLQVA